MSNIQTGDGIDSRRPENNGQAQAAALAGKVAALPARGIDPDARRGSESVEKSRRGRVWTVCHLAAWLAVLSLLVVAALRVFYHDGTFLLIWLNAFTRYVYLPAYLCLAWAAWQRRWLLALVSLIVVGFHVALLAPNFERDRRFDVRAEAAAADTVASRRLRIFFANVAVDNSAHQAMLREISAADPDVIVLLEYGWPWHLALKNAPEMAPYVHGSGHLQSHIGSVNLFSRLPLKKEVQSWVSGRAMHTVDIELGSQQLRLIGLHGPRPIDLPKYNYEEYWQQAMPLLTADQGPLVIVGDFNASEHSLVYKRLTSSRLRSAHDDRGRGYATTWPNGKFLLPPIRIDHVFLSPEVECERIVEGRGLGSDHKPLIVDVRVRGAAQEAVAGVTPEGE